MSDLMMQSINVKVTTHADPPLKVAEVSKQIQQQQPQPQQQYYQLRAGKQIDLQVLGQQAKQSSRSPKRYSQTREMSGADIGEGGPDSFIVGHASMSFKPTMIVKDKSGSLHSRRGSLKKYSSGGRDTPQSFVNIENSKYQSLRIDGDKVPDYHSNRFKATAPLQNKNLGGSLKSSSNPVRIANNTQSEGFFQSVGRNRLDHIGDSFSQTPKFEEYFSPMTPNTDPMRKKGKPPQLSAVKEQDKIEMQTASSGEHLGEIVPSIAVSRSKSLLFNLIGYVNSNTNQQEEGNVYVEHSYSSSIKNKYQQRNSERQNSSQLSQQDDARLDQKMLNFGTGIGSEGTYDMRPVLSIQEPLKGKSIDLPKSTVYQKSTLAGTSLGENLPQAATTLPAGDVTATNIPQDQILLPKAPGATTRQRVSHLYIKEGDFIYEISARDVAIFKKEIKKHKKETEDKRKATKLTGIQKQHQIKQTMGYVMPNLRPSVANSILQKIEDREKTDQGERKVIHEFFELLKYQGKARLFRPNKTQQGFKPFSKDMLFRSSVDESLLQASTLAGGFTTGGHSYLMNHSTQDGRSTAFGHRALIQQSDIIGGGQSIAQSQSQSHMTIFKRINSAANQGSSAKHQQSMDDLSINESTNLAFIDDAQHKSQEQRPSSFQGASSRFRVPYHSNSKGGSVHPNQENIGDTRNLPINKTMSSAKSYGRAVKTSHATHRGASQKEYQKIDTKRSAASSGYEVNCYIKPMPYLMNLPVMRKLVNFKKQGSPERHARQTSQISSFIESVNDNVQNMKPLIPLNEDLIDFQDSHMQSINDISDQARAKIEEIVQTIDKYKAIETPAPFEDSQHQASKSPQLLNSQGKIQEETGKIPRNIESQMSLTYHNDYQHQSEPRQLPWGRQYDGTTLNFQYMKTVRVQEYKLDLDSPKTNQDYDYAQQDDVQTLLNSSHKGGTKFSNTHIKMHINNQSSIHSKTSNHSSPHSRKSPTAQESRTAHAQSLKKHKINQNFRRLNSAQRKQDAAKVYYETPQFGQPQLNDGFDFHYHILSPNAVDGKSLLGEGPLDVDKSEDAPELSKKNILLSKKQMMSPDNKRPSSSSPEGARRQQMSPIKLETLQEAPQMPEEGGQNNENLEHIIEETCESVDSMGRGVSTHTMRSNFTPQPQTMPTSLGLVDKKKRRSQLRLTNSQNNPKPPSGSKHDNIDDNNYGLTQDYPNSDRGRNPTMNRSYNENETHSGRHKIVSKHSGTNIDRQFSEEHHYHDNFRRASSTIVEDSQFDRQLLLNMQPIKNHHPSASNLQGKRVNNFSIEQTEFISPDGKGQTSPQNTVRIISKLGIHKSGDNRPHHQGRQRQNQLEGLLLSGGTNTRASYPHVSSKGEFDAPPRYNHDSNAILNNQQKRSMDEVKRSHGEKLSTKIPGITKFEMISLPKVEPLVSGNTPMTGTLGTNHFNQKSNHLQIHQSQNKLIPNKDLTHHSQDPVELIKPRLVVKKRQNRRGLKDQSLETSSHELRAKQRRLNYSVATIVDIVPEAPQENLATEFDRANSAKKREHDMLGKLDQKKAQMIKRNMSVHTKANRKLKEIRDSKTQQASPEKAAIKNQLKTVPETEAGGYDQSYNAYLNSQASMLPGNVPSKYRIHQSKMSIDMASDLYQRSRVQGGFSELLTPNSNHGGGRPILSNNNLDRLSQQNSLHMLKNDDSSTIKDEGSHYNMPNLIQPKILSSTNIVTSGTGNIQAPKGIQIQTGQGFSRMNEGTNLGSKTKIPLPKTVVITQSPTNLINDPYQYSINRRGGSALGTDRMMNYINQMMVQINHNVENFGRSTADASLRRAPLNPDINQGSTIDSGVHNNASAAATLCNVEGAIIHSRYATMKNQHRRLKSSCGFSGGMMATNHGQFSAFGRCTTAAQSIRQASSKATSVNQSSHFTSMYNTKVNKHPGLFVGSTKIDINQERLQSSLIKSNYGNSLAIQTQGYQMRPGTSAVLHYNDSFHH